VRGASGHIRSTNEVRLTGVDGTTTVTIDGDVVLAGALGSVGQKIVAKQAGKVTAQFADNLQAALRGEPIAAAQPQRARRAASSGPAATPVGGPPPADYWSKVAAVMSTVSAVLSLIAIIRSRRRPS
jgi:hypothetical protein